MAEYCTAADLQKRLTAAGYGNVADRDQDGDVSADEVSNSVTSSIVWAGSLIDAHISERYDVASARASGNPFLRDRCLDLAACRLATQGGRDAPSSFQHDQDLTLALLERIRDAGDAVPGLVGRSAGWKANSHDVFEIPSQGTC